MIIKLIVDAGEMKAGPAIAQKLGPLGINMGKVISEVNKATASFKGMKVPAILDINTKTKDFSVTVATPPTSELLKKEFGLEKGSGDAIKIRVANAAIEQIIKIAKIKEKDMLTKEFRAAVKNVLGSCVSLGVLVESEDPKIIVKKVEAGEYDDAIKKQIENASPEKMEKLQQDFTIIKEKQEKMLKEEEAVKAAKEAEKLAAKAPAEGAAAPAAGAAAAAPGAPVAAAAATAGAAAPAEKAKEEKKEKK